jgi:hypothetical protein
MAYGVVFLRLGGGLGCFSPAIEYTSNIDKRHCVWPHQRLLHPRLYLEQLAMAASPNDSAVDQQQINKQQTELFANNSSWSLQPLALQQIDMR